MSVGATQNQSSGNPYIVPGLLLGGGAGAAIGRYVIKEEKGVGKIYEETADAFEKSIKTEGFTEDQTKSLNSVKSTLGEKAKIEEKVKSFVEKSHTGETAEVSVADFLKAHKGDAVQTKEHIDEIVKNDIETAKTHATAIADKNKALQELPKDATEDATKAAKAAVKDAETAATKFAEEAKANKLLQELVAGAKDGKTIAKDAVSAKYAEGLKGSLMEQLADGLKGLKGKLPKIPSWKNAAIYGGVGAGVALILAFVFGSGKKAE